MNKNDFVDSIGGIGGDSNVNTGGSGSVNLFISKAMEFLFNILLCCFKFVLFFIWIQY